MTAGEAQKAATEIAANPAVKWEHHVRAKELESLILGVGISLEQGRALVAAKLADYAREEIANAADIMLSPSNDPKQVVRRMIYRRMEGENHGPAETWEDYAALCRQDMEEAEAAQEKAEKEAKAEAATSTALLWLLYDIRVAAGDPEGRLMQDELVEHIARLAANKA